MGRKGEIAGNNTGFVLLCVMKMNVVKVVSTV